MNNTIIHGDVANVIVNIPNNSIHLTFTSPPYYNTKNYSTYHSYQEYLDFLTNIFEQVHRITKEGRFFILNTSPVIVPRISRSHASKRLPIPYDIHPRLIKIGWEFIDDIIWVKPEPSVKNRTASFSQHRKPLAYKPNVITEMIMVYRKKTDKLIDWNINQYDDKTIQDSKILGNYETTNVWSIAPARDKIHSAVFPVQLCEKIIKYYSFKNDLVFDPFAGSGTVGKVATIMGRNFLLIEQKEEYINRIKTKLQKYCNYNNNSHVSGV